MTKKEFKFSFEQEEAIKDAGTNTLVSAGAGSGKTAVLTERVCRLVASGTDLSQFLVLTFTNAAANQMKVKIRQKLLENSQTSSLAQYVDCAHIETFDAFALFLVQKYFYKVGVSKDINILDTNVFAIKEKEIINQIFDEYYEKEDAQLISLVDKYCVKNDDKIVNFALMLQHTANKQINPEAFLDSIIPLYFKKEFIASIVDDYYFKQVNILKNIINMAYQLENAEDADNIINYCNLLLTASDYDRLYHLLQENNSFPIKKSTKENTDGEFRDYIKNYYDKNFKKDSDFGTKQEIIDSYLTNQSNAELIIRIVKELRRRLDVFKKSHNAYPFADVANMANRILDDESICHEIASSFRYIMVDEYQDTSDIQEAVLQKLGRHNLYFVGDVKQSIYRFRNANCSLFQEKYNVFPRVIDPEKGYRVDLNSSYRSRPEVVNIINEIFEKLFDKNFNPIDYQDGHHFKFGRDQYLDLIDESSDYNFQIYRYEPLEDKKNNYEKEAKIIIDDIINKVNNHYKVCDDDIKYLRDVQFSDFAIIIDRTKRFDFYRRLFSEKNIPIQIHDKEEVSSSDIGFVFKNLLKLLQGALDGNYEGEYVHAYVSIARSFLFNQKDAEIYKVVKEKDFLKTALGRQIELIKEQLRFVSLERILATLSDTFAVNHQIASLGKFKNNANKVALFINLAKSFDILGYSLKQFVQYFDDINDIDSEIAFDEHYDDVNAVHLIDIHKSKGLEYKVVYYPGLTEGFNREEVKSSFVFDKTYGLLMPLSADNNKNSLFLSLFKKKTIQEDFEEKIRLFYVALTRAKEKIILIHPQKKDDVVIRDITVAKCFDDFLTYLQLDKKYGTDVDITNNVLEVTNDDIDPQKIKLEKISCFGQLVQSAHASKTISQRVDENLLLFGTRIHRYLEVVNFETKDLSFIKDEKEKQYVLNILKHPLFENVKNDNIKHEFAFEDKNTNVSGVIDALIVNNEEITIVDFKLKNISDEAYDTQLNIYRSYIHSITDKPVKCFLISAITGESREVK